MKYKEGYSYCFDSSKCESCGAKCCIGESGYIYVDEERIKILQEYFSLSLEEVQEKFLIKVGARFSFKEKPYEKGWACIFFDEEKKNCSIYEIRPEQCRTFPFWPYFKKNFEELEQECIGVKAL